MKRISACIFVLGASLVSAPLSGQPDSRASSEEIVITAQRSGIPVWRVRGGAGTLVIVGTIEEVAKGTNWNPELLAAALRGADQVMFPEDIQYSGGLLSIMGLPGKARRMERLPQGDTLANYLPPRQFARLLALRDRGVLKPGFELRRPLFVAYDLTQAGKGEQPGGFLSISRVDWKTDPSGFVHNAIHKYHLRLLPMRREALNGALARLAATPPAAQVPCLVAAADFAEAGPTAFRARSQAWAARRVGDVVSSPAEKAFTTCAAVIRNPPSPPEIEASLMTALRQPATTVAVLELSTLAQSGGVLDHLAAQGFEITGPKWH